MTLVTFMNGVDLSHAFESSLYLITVFSRAAIPTKFLVNVLYFTFAALLNTCRTSLLAASHPVKISIIENLYT